MSQPNIIQRLAIGLLLAFFLLVAVPLGLISIVLNVLNLGRFETLLTMDKFIAACVFQRSGNYTVSAECQYRFGLLRWILNMIIKNHTKDAANGEGLTN